MGRSIYQNPGDLAYIEHDGVLHESPDAILYQIENEEIWLPKSQIKDSGEELVAIPKWLADKKGLKSGW